MLLFDPAKRIDVVQALAHPYMDSLHCEEDEPECTQVFTHQLNRNCVVNDIKELVFGEVVAYHPDAAAELAAVKARRMQRRAQVAHQNGVHHTGAASAGRCLFLFLFFLFFVRFFCFCFLFVLFVSYVLLLAFFVCCLFVCFVFWVLLAVSLFGVCLLCFLGFACCFFVWCLFPLLNSGFCLLFLCLFLFSVVVV